MSKNSRSPTKKLGMLANSLTEDVLRLSDEEILAEDNALVQAQAIRSSVFSVLANARKKKLQMARQDYNSSPEKFRAPAKRPPLEEIKRRIESLFVARKDLSLAFRNRSHQSDPDWESLWDDLAEMGLLDENDAQR